MVFKSFLRGRIFLREIMNDSCDAEIIQKTHTFSTMVRQRVRFFLNDTKLILQRFVSVRFLDTQFISHECR